jgi:predicted transcriptional regulator
MSRSNIKGAFERARDRWNCALICTATEELGRGAASVFTVAILMNMHVNRKEFERSGHLLAFPSLDRLAFMAGLAKSTVQRAIKRLTKLGLLAVKHRFDASNLYYLTIPTAAEEHSGTCLNMMTNNRHRTTRNLKGVARVTRGVVNSASGHDVSDHLHSDRHSDLHSLSIKSRALAARQDREGKGAGEKGGETQAETTSDHLAKPLGPAASSNHEARSVEAECFDLARKIEPGRGPSLCAAALKYSILSAEDVLSELRECYEKDGDIGEYLGPALAPR